MFKTPIKQLIQITERPKAERWNTLLLALLCSLFTRSLTQQLQRKDLWPAHVLVPKGLEAPAHMMRMSSTSSAAVWLHLPTRGQKQMWVSSLGDFFILVLNQKSVFFVLLKLYASAKNVQHLTLLVQSFIEAAVLAYISDKSFKF